MNRWIEGARPKTLPASIVPVLVGTAAAHNAFLCRDVCILILDLRDDFIPWRFAAALVVSLALQVAVNYANDYFDAVKGVDTPERLGPRRLTASGVVTRSEMKLAILAAMGVAGIGGIALAAFVGWEILLVGLAAFLALLAYSGGPKPYASLGLGEVFVFVFFGIVATVGSAYVQIEQVTLLAFLASIPVGLLATSILVVNNLRDIGTDTRAGKRTVAVRLGRAGTIALYEALLALAFFAVIPVAVAAGSYAPALAILAAPFAVRAGKLVATRTDPPGLIAGLVGTARLHLVFGILLAVGLWIR